LDFPEDYSKSALVQFVDGELNKAIWVHGDGYAWDQQILPEAFWIKHPEEGYFRIDPDNLSVSFNSNTKVSFELKDATKWAKERVRL
jgi:hypothetical protein